MAKVGVGVGVVPPRIPIDTRQTPYEVVEVGVARQVRKPKVGSRPGTRWEPGAPQTPQQLR